MRAKIVDDILRSAPQGAGENAHLDCVVEGRDGGLESDNSVDTTGIKRAR